MDPRDLLRAFPDGIACTVCDQPVPAERIQLLARRDDMSFVQIECAACRSTGLGFLADPAMTTGASGSPRHADANHPPISSDDVIEMHQLLAHWQGDVHDLVGNHGGRTSRGDRSLPPR